jgi:hypothetical protein
MSTEAEATLKAARISARASIAAAVLAAVATCVVALWSWMTDRQRQQDEILRLAANGTTKVAYCNILLWKEAGLIRGDVADKVIKAFNEQRDVDPDCKKVTAEAKK